MGSSTSFFNDWDSFFTVSSFTAGFSLFLSSSNLLIFRDTFLDNDFLGGAEEEEVGLTPEELVSPLLICSNICLACR